MNTGAITLTSGGVAVLHRRHRVHHDVQSECGEHHVHPHQCADHRAYTVNGGNGSDFITGGDHATGDTLNGGGGADTLNGGIGHDLLTGGAGRDIVNGDIGNDLMFLAAQSDAVAGESYTGGSGFDVLVLEAAGAMDISALLINADIERLEAIGAVSLTAAQLGNFESVSTGAITLTTGGTANLSDANDIATQTFNLNAAGNTFNLSGNSVTMYTVNGGAGVDIITGGDHSGGDTLGGGGGNDQLAGVGGPDNFRWTSMVSGTDTLLDFSGITAFGGGDGGRRSA